MDPTPEYVINQTLAMNELHHGTGLKVYGPSFKIYIIPRLNDISESRVLPVNAPT